MSNFSDDGWGTPFKPSHLVVMNDSPVSSSQSSADPSTKVTPGSDTQDTSMIDPLGNAVLNAMKVFLNDMRCRHGPIETAILALENDVYIDSNAKAKAKVLEENIQEINEEAKEVLRRVDMHLAQKPLADQQLAEAVRSSANKIFAVSAIHSDRLNRWKNRTSGTTAPSSLQENKVAAPEPTQTFNHSGRIHISSNKVQNGVVHPNGADPVMFGFVGMLEQINHLVGSIGTIGMGRAQPAYPEMQLKMIKGLLDILAETGEKFIALRDNYSKLYS